jgi:hypothetical protein
MNTGYREVKTIHHWFNKIIRWIPSFTRETIPGGEKRVLVGPCCS